jgi:hypothetical protein
VHPIARESDALGGSHRAQVRRGDGDAQSRTGELRSHRLERGRQAAPAAARADLVGMKADSDVVDPRFGLQPGDARLGPDAEMSDQLPSFREPEVSVRRIEQRRQLLLVQVICRHLRIPPPDDLLRVGLGER